MIDLSTPDTVVDLYERDKSQYHGTILEGFHLLLQQHEPVLEFIVETSDKYTPDAFIGSEESLLAEGVEFDEEAFRTQLRESDTVDLSDFLAFDYAMVSFFLLRMREQTETWAEMRSAIAQAAGGAITEDDVDVMVDRSIDQLVESFDVAMDAVEDDTQRDILQQIRDSVALTSRRDLFLQTYSRRAETVYQRLKTLRYLTATPSLDTYFVYEIRPHQKHLMESNKYDFDFDASTRYNIIGKITGHKIVAIDGGVDYVDEYSFDVLAYDSEVTELYERLWLLDSDERIQPKHQDNLRFYDESPLGTVETKITIGRLPSARED